MSRVRLLALTVVALCGLLVMSLLASLSLGSHALTPVQVWLALRDESGLNAQIVQQLRLPRTLAAACCGALLSVAGALLQGLLRNPLADPYVLGMSGGAAVGALFAILLGGSVLAPIGALLGALAITLLVFLLGNRALSAPAGAAPAGVTLILVGVVLAAACGALVSLLLVLLPAQPLRATMLWLMGDFSGVSSALLVLASGLVLLPVALWLAPDLNIIASGEVRAATLGVPVARRRKQIIALAAMMTAAAVYTAGPIGFVGLVVPHVVRLAIGPDQRVLVPSSALLGAAFLVCADTVSRTVVAPTQLPVGAVTAAVGVPVFLGLLLRRGLRT